VAAIKEDDALRHSVVGEQRIEHAARDLQGWRLSVTLNSNRGMSALANGSREGWRQQQTKRHRANVLQLRFTLNYINVRLAQLQPNR